LGGFWYTGGTGPVDTGTSVDFIVTTNSFNVNKHQKGFTLIELLVVIGIIAVLIGVFVSTINLGRPFQQARDAQRASNVSSIASAMKSRMADNRGVWTSGGTTGCPAIDSDPVYIVASTSDEAVPGATADTNPTSDADGYATLQNCLVDRYMLSIPEDPSLETASNSLGITGYRVSITNNRVTVSAPFYEGDTLPSITN